MRSYLLVTCVLFALVAVAHLLRAVAGVEVEVDGQPLPTWPSWLLVVVGALFCGWALRLLGERST